MNGSRIPTWDPLSAAAGPLTVGWAARGPLKPPGRTTSRVVGWMLDVPSSTHPTRATVATDTYVAARTAANTLACP
jgi:hypothetical protein